MPPAPPMGPEPPMDGNIPPAPPMGDEPMGDEPDSEGGDDNELMDIINGLSVEDKAAVKKYAESMADDSSDNSEGDDAEMPPMPDDGGQEPPMPMENKRFINSMVNEISNELLGNGKKGTKRHEKNITNTKISKRNPFVSNR